MAAAAQCACRLLLQDTIKAPLLCNILYKDVATVKKKKFSLFHSIPNWFILHLNPEPC